MEDYGTPVHHSLTRPQTILGCDRELFLSLALVCGMLCVTGIMQAMPAAIALGALLWITGQIGLARMGKRDAYLRHVFMRSLRYRPYYLAVSAIPDLYKPIYKRW